MKLMPRPLPHQEAKKVFDKYKNYGIVLVDEEINLQRVGDRRLH